MALMHVLDELTLELGCRLVVAHLDHGLRAESPRDADFVLDAAARLGHDAHLERSDVRRLAADQGISIEEAGRRTRYDFFERLRVGLSAQVVATAHHRDDAIETFFLRVLRGSSIRGLGGIPPRRGNVIRPLIRANRAEILDYLVARGIPYLTDETNLDANTDRNFIRNRLLPVARERFPGFDTPLLRTMSLIRIEDAFLDEAAEKIRREAIVPDHDGLVADVVKLRALPDALVARVMVLMLYEASGPMVRWKRSHVDACLELVRSQNPSASADFPCGIRARREYERFVVQRDVSVAAEEGFALLVEGEREIDIPGTLWKLGFRILAPTGRGPVDSQRETIALFDGDAVPFPLIVRNPRPGDRIRPWGLAGSRKLKKVLIDARVPGRERQQLPIVVKGNEILWIPGVRRGTVAGLHSRTRRVLEMRVLASPRWSSGNERE